MYKEMSAPEMLAACGDDASKWAAAFCEIANAQLGGAPLIDQECMSGWFAAAIEYSHDVRTGRGAVVLPDGSAFFVA